MKMHLQATENLPNAMFSRVLYPWGGDQNAEAGWKFRRRKNCFRCLREDKLVRQMITFWHDQGGKCDANKTHMKANELNKLSFVRPFHLVGLPVHEAHGSELLELPREPFLGRVVLALARHRNNHL